MKQIKIFKDKKEKLPDIVKYTSVVTSPVDNSSAEDRRQKRERDSAVSSWRCTRDSSENF